MDETGMRKRNLCLLTCFLVPVTRQRKSQSLEGSAFACQRDKETFQDFCQLLSGGEVSVTWTNTTLSIGTRKNFFSHCKWDLIRAILALFRYPLSGIFISEFTLLTWTFLLEVWSPGSLLHYPKESRLLHTPRWCVPPQEWLFSSQSPHWKK